jgi:cytochrome P450
MGKLIVKVARSAPAPAPADLRLRADGPARGKPDSRFMPTDQETDMTTTNTRQHAIAAACEALGVPRQDWQLFSRWGAGPMTPKASDELHHYVDVMIADRCRRPGDDLISKLIELEVDGEELTVDDIQNFVAALVAGVN